MTDRPNGTTDGVLSPDGAWIWWFDDNDGDEFGVWRGSPSTGGAGRAGRARSRGLLPGGPGPGPGRPYGGRGLFDRRGGHHDPRRAAPASDPVEIYRHRESAGVGDLSHDGSLIAVEHTEHGDAMHSALRVLRPDGTDGRRAATTPRAAPRNWAWRCLGFAPVDGDTRLLVGHQRRGRWEPLVWDVATARRRTSTSTCRVTWAPSGIRTARALLVAHSFEARSELFRYDLASGKLVKVADPARLGLGGDGPARRQRGVPVVLGRRAVGGALDDGRAWFWTRRG